MSAATIRPAALAGSWYPADATELQRATTHYLAAESPAAKATPLPPSGRISLLMVPHAGFLYSGPTAGAGYRLLRQGDYDRIIILAPNHRQHLQTISCPDYTGFRTPLGVVDIDTEAVSRLARCPVITLGREAHVHEHAVEIQLPLLQTAFPDMPPIVPLLVPHLSDAERREAGRCLREILDDRSLLIVSTDMTHYGREFGFTPFVDDLDEEIRELDQGALDRILAWDMTGLLAYADRTGITMCGLQSMALAMEALGPGALDLRLVSYARSGDRDGNYAFSVSYSTIIGYETTGARPAKP